ncbi:MAG: aryl-sulfate sulfotransferase [Candidatus Sulfotelmatobacter sp.]
MKTFWGAVCASAVFLLALASVGCGSGSSAQPGTSVSATSQPLVAQYNIGHFHSGLTAWVEFGTDTTYGRQTSVVTDSAPTIPGGQVLNILVAGMLPNTTYHMRAHVEWSGGSWVDQDHTFTTGTLPTAQPVPQLTIATPSQGNASAALAPAPGVEFLSLVNGPTNAYNAVAADLSGNVIWACPGEAIPFKLLPNGHMFMMRGSGLEEIDLACKAIRLVTLTELNQSLQAQGYSFPPVTNLHHDMLVLPNGHWIALGQVTKDVTAEGYGTLGVQGDVLMDIDLKGNVAWAWSSFDHLDVNRHLFGLPDWTHSNALVYTADGNLLLSMRNQSWILKIDYENGAGTGNILWRLGNDGDFTLQGDNPADWFYAQHYPNILSVNGSQTTMAVYDDGDLRIGANGQPCEPPIPPVTNCYTRAAIFQIDESTMVASLQWQYLPGFFSFWGGSIDVLSNNDVEFDSSAAFGYATSSLIEEVTQTDTPQTVWQMTITGSNAYRGFRSPSLYPGVTWQQ